MNAAARIRLLAIWLAMAPAGAAGAGEARCWIDNGAVVVPAAYGPIAGDFILDLSQAQSQLHDTAARTAGSTENVAHWTLRLAGQTKARYAMKVADLDARIASFPHQYRRHSGRGRAWAHWSRWTWTPQPCRLRLTRATPRARRSSASEDAYDRRAYRPCLPASPTGWSLAYRLVRHRHRVRRLATCRRGGSRVHCRAVSIRAIGPRRRRGCGRFPWAASSWSRRPPAS